MVAASIGFNQPGGAGSGAAGFALLGLSTDIGKPVTVFNGDNTNVTRWVYEIFGVSDPASVVSRGVVQDGQTPTYTFTPDKQGGYGFHLTTYDKFNNVAEDFRCFVLAESTGRVIVPFRATDKMLNFTRNAALNLTGWADLQREYDKKVDAQLGSVARLNLFNGLTSTQNDGSSPQRVADQRYDRTKLMGSTSAVNLIVGLETNDSSSLAHVDLLDIDGVATGGGGPGSIVAGSPMTTASTFAVELSADLSAPLKAAGTGRFRVRLWTTTGGKVATISYAYLELTP